jgi:hypothetical protein
MASTPLPQDIDNRTRRPRRVGVPTGSTPAPLTLPDKTRGRRDPRRDMSNCATTDGNQQHIPAQPSSEHQSRQATDQVSAGRADGLDRVPSRSGPQTRRAELCRERGKLRRVPALPGDEHQGPSTTIAVHMPSAAWSTAHCGNAEGMTGARRSYSTQTADHMPGVAHPTAALRPNPAAEAVYRLTFAPPRCGDLDPPAEAVSWLTPVHRRVRRPGLVSGCRWSANACSIAVLRPGPASGCPFHCDDQRGPEAYWS